MTDLPYTYTDEDDTKLEVEPGLISIHERDEPRAARVNAPTSEDAVALVRAVLASAGDTGHVVISRDELTAIRRADARSMRERALAAIQPRWDLQSEAQAEARDAIRALTLLPDSDGTTNTQDGLRAPEPEAAYDQVMEERDTAMEWADRLAAAIAPAGVRGEHSNTNNPWQNALDYAAGATSTVHVATPEGITPCGKGHHDVTVAALIPEITCVECLRTVAIEKGGQIVDLRRDRDRLRTAWHSARRGRTQAREQLADARRWGRILEAQRAELRTELRAAREETGRLPEEDLVEPGDEVPDLCELAYRVTDLEQQYTDLANLVHGHSEDLTQLKRRFTEENGIRHQPRRPT